MYDVLHLTNAGATVLAHIVAEELASVLPAHGTKPQAQDLSTSNIHQ